MPGVIPQLMQQPRSENYSGADVARKFQTTSLFWQPFCALPSAPNTTACSRLLIRSRLSLIGQDGLRQLITSGAFQPIGSLHSGPLFRIAAPRLWEQSEICARVNRFLALESGIDHFPAFLAGLIKNVGLNILMRMTDARPLTNQPIGTPEFWDAMNFHSSILTARIAREWHFPDEVINAIDETRHRASASRRPALGTLLEHGDCLSKLQILTENDVRGAQDISASWNMNERERMCMQEMCIFARKEPPSRTSK